MRFDRMITAVEAHAGGEPGRVITGGIIDVPGATMFAKMQHLQQHRDEIRKLMLREPRGYPGLCCNILLPPTEPSADAGFVIMEQVEYPPMSGSNTICVTTVLLEAGILPMHEPETRLTLEAPAGLIDVVATCANGKVTGVTFQNRPAFAAYLDTEIDVPTLGRIVVDVAYGGMWYVIVDASQVGLEIVPAKGADIVRLGELIKAAAREQLRPSSSGEPGHCRNQHSRVHRSRPCQAPMQRTRSSFRLARSIGTILRPGPACSTGPLAAPAPARAWRSCTPRASSRSIRTSSTRASWELRSPGA
ncbi:MAG: proline racemase family protein [Thermomicrobiales bacterium]